MNKQFAWFLGFLASDGSIICPTYRNKGDERHIGFTIHHKDKNALNLVKKITSTNANVREYPNYKSPQAQINIYDRMDIIEKYKNIKNEIPENIKGFERHYLRGLVDGDGCLHYRQNRKTLSVIFVNEKYEIVDGFTTILSNLLGIEKKEPNFVPKDNLYRVSWEGKIARLIAWYLYHGDIDDCVLQRKLDYFNEYVNKGIGLDGFIKTINLDIKQQHILPKTSSADSLYWCKILQKCLKTFFNINTTPIPVNKGTKKYYELYVSIANMQGLRINN